MFLRNLLIVSCLFAGSSCLSQTAPEPVRWFMPAVEAFDPEVTTPQRPLYLRPLSSSTHLREQMVWRLSPVEVFFDEQERWGARPAEIARSVFEEALFATGPFIQSEASDALHLSIALQAFEGVYGKEDLAVCEIFVVHDDGELVRQSKFRSTSTLESREPDELARGLGRALHEIAVKLRTWTQTSG